MKNKMSKEIIPEGFTLGMVFSDMLPVLFFGGTTVIIGLILGNIWISIGAAVAFVSGLLKVVWKLIVVTKKENVWWLFIQMRIFMPIGLAIFLIGLVFSLSKMPAQTVIAALIGMPQLIFFILGIAGMVAMILFAMKLDSADAKSNWIEQITNGLAQACFFVGTLILMLK